MWLDGAVEHGVRDRFGVSGELVSMVGVLVEDDHLLFFPMGLDGVANKDSSMDGGQDVGLLDKPGMLTGETVLPFCSTNLCTSSSCFFLLFSFLYTFRQRG